MNKLETKIDEVLDAVHIFAENVDQRFEQVDQRLARVESQMVTKDYLDDKLADLRGDLTVSIRRVDAKDSALVNILERTEAITKDEMQEILALGPFPHLN